MTNKELKIWLELGVKTVRQLSIHIKLLKKDKSC